MSINPLAVLKAELADLPEILDLQKREYLSEALMYQDFSIPPLHQTLESFQEEFEKGIVLKLMLENNLVGSVRAFEKDGICYIGKLIVKSGFQNKGFGKLLMLTIESFFPSANKFELFTGFKSEKNLYIYKKLGFKEIRREQIKPNLVLVFLQKDNHKRMIELIG